MRPLTKKFLLATFLALSMEVTVQASTVTMTLRNVTVKQAIVDLQKNTGYSVVIYAKDVDMNRRVSVDARNEWWLMWWDKFLQDKMWTTK